MSTRVGDLRSSFDFLPAVDQAAMVARMVLWDLVVLVFAIVVAHEAFARV